MAGSFDHWSLPALGTVAGCNYSETECQTLLQIRPMSCLFVKHVLWWASVNTTPSLQYRLRLLSSRNMPPSSQLSLIRQHTLSLLPLSSRMLNWQEELEKTMIACDVYLMFSVECSSWGWAGPSAGREDGASEAGTSSAVGAHTGCSLWQGLREVRHLM